jgi:hypothetical protein
MVRIAAVVASEPIEQLILIIRGQRVMVDADLARLYGVATKRLNEQVRRNRDRFPADFMFQLTAAEKAEVVANCDHLRALKFSKALPHVFTEHGAVMLASVLNTPPAVEVSVLVVRAFVRLREILATHRTLAAKLGELEQRLSGHDKQIIALVDAIRHLTSFPAPPKRRIGFVVKEAPATDGKPTKPKASPPRQ